MVQKNKKWRLFTKGASDYIIWVVTMLLLALGIIMVLSASSPASLSETGKSYKYVTKQAMAAGIGLVGMICVSKIDYQVYKKLKWIIYIFLIAILVYTGLFGIEGGGAKRWIKLPIIGNFQPSELGKLGFIIFYAALLSEIKEKGKIKSFVHGCLIPMAFLVPIAFSIYILQNHFSATFIIAMITIVQMFVAGTRIGHIMIVGAFGACAYGGASAIKNLLKPTSTAATATEQSFRKSRVAVWLNPSSDPKGKGWQILQSLYTIASGGLFGVGLGKSKQKYLYLPEPQNDFIFAVLAEELGFFGCAFVIVLFGIFIWRGIVIAMKAPDTFSSLIAIGIVTMIGLQAIINIAVVTNTIPVTGMPLPFFSYGGTAIIIDLVSVGVLLNISRHCNQK